MYGEGHTVPVSTYVLITYVEILIHVLITYVGAFEKLSADWIV